MAGFGVATEALFITPLDPHPNAKANRLIAEQLKQWIMNNAIGLAWRR